ncbi:signal recognition particle-docking protein FtsY [Devosia sp.]|jgi:fused signal recognition particle receptor|uniref:signal recognition particle-docking protein FtsY n=1 Tax=Devosia sp. TaxID=1871048 RepID=UPI0037BE419F
MAEKKKGFFQRLFGGGDAPAPAPAPEPVREHTVAEDLEADIVLDEVVEAAPLVLPPEQELALAEALHDAGEIITPEGSEPEPQPPAPPREHTVAEDLEADIILDEVVEAAPLVLPPDQELALAQAMHEAGESITPAAHEPPPGPPETTPTYIERVEHPTPAPAAPAKKLNWFQRLATGLKRSSDQLTTGIASVFTKKKLDAAMLEDLEDILIQSDFGLEMASQVTEKLRRERFDRDISTEEVREILAGEIVGVLSPVARPIAIDTAKKPFVILMVGVNGTGKTTTIGKLSSLFAAQGKSVMLAAGDTFRAAAIEQLQVWGQRTGAPVVSRPAGSDASGLAFDAVTRAAEEGTDVLLIDTAGRLHNRDELMSELEKIIRVIKKVDPEAPHATLLTLDATTGQNALNQVEIFGQRAGVTGLVMTKLDGTARGGILVAIAQKFGLPVHFIGVGEGVDNLEPFDAREFAEAIAGKTA